MFENIPFVYEAPENITDSYQPKEDKRWTADFFIIPRKGDSILSGDIWWKVENVSLTNSQVYQINVSYEARR